MILPPYHLAGASPLPLDMGYLFLVGSNILQSTVVQQQVNNQQEASISLLSLSIREQQNENHNHRKLIKLIIWTTALSNSMKL